MSEPKAYDRLRCPRCHSKMMLRNGSRGEFLGCKAFPQCRYTASLANANMVLGRVVGDEDLYPKRPDEFDYDDRDVGGW